MGEWISPVIGWLGVALLGVIALFLRLAKKGLEEAAKTGAEEAVKESFRSINWPAELARELQKSRGIERQERRYESYGRLWKRLKPLAIYDDTSITKDEMLKLRPALSNWYFSVFGGLLLTPQAREFYFALQDLLAIVTQTADDWTVRRAIHPSSTHRDVFLGMLNDKGLSEPHKVLKYLEPKTAPLDWQDEALGLAVKWREGIKVVAKNWGGFSDEQKFVTLQQVGSVLRTCLTYDVESRLL
jgi:hypothetical protein